MTTMTETFKCTNCGRDGLTDANPWHSCYDAKMIATRDEILRLKALQSDGNLMAGMGIRPWDRERGAQTAQRATDALAEIMAGLSIEDLRYIHELNMASA